MTGFRTYLSLIAIIIHQVLNALGFTEVTGESLSMAIDTVFAICAFIFHKIHKPKV